MELGFLRRAGNSRGGGVHHRSGSGVLTGPGELGDGAVPDLVFELWRVVVHVDHVDHDVNRVLHRVSVLVHDVYPHLEPEHKPTEGRLSVFSYVSR